VTKTLACLGTTLFIVKSDENSSVQCFESLSFYKCSICY